MMLNSLWALGSVDLNSFTMSLQVARVFSVGQTGWGRSNEGGLSQKTLHPTQWCPVHSAHMAMCACVCAGLTVSAERVWKNIYHGPKQESSQGVLNGPACLEKPFSKWMPLSIRVSDRNLPRAMPAGNKIASLCVPFLFMRSLFPQTKKKLSVCKLFLSLSYMERDKEVS